MIPPKQPTNRHGSLCRDLLFVVREKCTVHDDQVSYLAIAQDVGALFGT